MEETLKNWSDQIIPWLTNHGIRILVIAVLALLIDRVLKRLIVRTVRASVKSDEHTSADAEKKREETLIRIFTGAMNIVIVVVALMMIIGEMGIEIGPLIAGAGIVGLAVGFGGQYLIRDIITGLFLMLENQYRIGDVVDIEGLSGAVEDISLRKTTLRNLDGTVHHIPHGSITKVSNLSKDFARVNIDMGVGYSTDIDHLIKVINETGRELAADPAFSDAIISPPQFLRVNEFADSAIIVKILGDTKPLKQWEIAGEFRKRLKFAFDREGIEIPFPQTVIHQIKE
ncbi:MAG: mechanosensitive ion channel family protein [Bacteroidales bacterium]|jgi:small conductance mechanosensitive channel|nr:mechanosensitive ion channel family protein [Bacteroidales bacterium]